MEKRLQVICPHCQKILTVPDEYKRKQIKCGACHQVFVIKPIKEASELPISKQSSLPESNRTLWITAIIVATGLAWVIGFACGALMTRSKREEAKVGAITQEQAQPTKAKITPSKEAPTKPNLEQKPRKSLTNREFQIITADEQRMENNMNSTGYKTYCHTLLNEEGTIDIVMTSGSFKDSVSREAIDNYIGAAVATVGKFTSNAKWESRKLIIKVAFGKWYEISTSHCRKTVELFNKQLYQKASNYMFAHLKEVKNN